MQNTVIRAGASAQANKAAAQSGTSARAAKCGLIVLGDVLKFSNRTPSAHQLAIADIFAQVWISVCSV